MSTAIDRDQLPARLDVPVQVDELPESVQQEIIQAKMPDAPPAALDEDGNLVELPLESF